MASAFSFLQGASLPEAIVDRAAELGYTAIALLDRDGVYGMPRFHKAARAAGIRPLVGAEVTIGREGLEGGGGRGGRGGEGREGRDGRGDREGRQGRESREGREGSQEGQKGRKGQTNQTFPAVQ